MWFVLGVLLFAKSYEINVLMGTFSINCSTRAEMDSLYQMACSVRSRNELAMALEFCYKHNQMVNNLVFRGKSRTQTKKGKRKQNKSRKERWKRRQTPTNSWYASANSSMMSFSCSTSSISRFMSSSYKASTPSLRFSR